MRRKTFDRGSLPTVLLTKTIYTENIERKNLIERSKMAENNRKDQKKQEKERKKTHLLLNLVF